MNGDKWHEWRRQGVGSSDAPVILGVDDRKTRLQLYLEKLGRAREESRAEYLEWGIELEDDIARMYTRRTGVAVRARQVNIECDDASFIRASIDIVTVNDSIVETKALGIWAANNFHAKDGDWESLPHKWIVQAHHQMLVFGADFAEVAVFYPLELRLYRVPKSERLLDTIWQLEHEFWQCVQDKEPPRTLDPTDAEMIQLAYPTIADYAAEIPPELVGDVDRYHANPKDASAKVALLDFLGDAECGLCPDGRVIRRTVKFRKGYKVEDKREIILTVESKGEPCPQTNMQPSRTT